MVDNLAKAAKMEKTCSKFEDIKKFVFNSKKNIAMIRDFVLDEVILFEDEIKSLELKIKDFEIEVASLKKKIEFRNKQILKIKAKSAEEVGILQAQLREVRSGTEEGRYINELLDEIESLKVTIQQNDSVHDSMSEEIRAMSAKNTRLKVELASQFRERHTQKNSYSRIVKYDV